MATVYTFVGSSALDPEKTCVWLVWVGQYLEADNTSARGCTLRDVTDSSTQHASLPGVLVVTHMYGCFRSCNQMPYMMKLYTLKMHL